MILLLVVMLLTFIATLWVIPRLIQGLINNKMLDRDYYKEKETWVPSKGGLVLLSVCAFAITIIPLIIYFSRQVFFRTGIDFLQAPYLLEINYFIMLPLLAYGIFGMLDDYMDISKPIKVLLPIIFAAPLILASDPIYLDVPFYGEVHLKTFIYEPISYRAIYRFMLIPLYIMVAAHLVNMHSGFNGLASGTSLIVLFTLIAKVIYEVAFQEGTSADIVAIGAFTGGLIAFWIYNRYPSKIIEGNTGSLMMGAAIGITIVVRGYLFAGFVCLIPHTVNFFLYLYWRIKRYMAPNDPKWKLTKWGKLREDGTLEVPNKLTLKWILPFHFKMTEKKAVYAMYGLTAVFCAIGFFIPY